VSAADMLAVTVVLSV